MRIAFLIGAGASYGSGVIAPRQPPLGGQLFSEMRTAFPATWGRIAGHRATAFSPDFEKGMDQLWAEQPDDISDLLNDMGRYFVQFEPARGHPNHYSELLFMLRVKGLLQNCVFASLNYECILEIAGARLGLLLSYAAAGAAAGALRVLKPHGSCNFLPPAGLDPLGSGNVFKNVAQFYNAVAPRPIEDARRRYAEAHFLPPVMSLFAPGKLTPAAREAIDALRSQWREWVVSSDYVAVVGSRPNLSDGHVWDPIIESTARVWHLSGTEDDYAQFSRRLGDRLEHLGTRFDDAGLDRLTAAIQRA